MSGIEEGGMRGIKLAETKNISCLKMKTGQQYFETKDRLSKKTQQNRG